MSEKQTSPAASKASPSASSQKRLKTEEKDIAKKILSEYLSLVAAKASSRMTKYLKGKEAIIVGPDTSIQGLGWGRRIEAHDAVVRINTALNFVPFKKSLQADVGTRTDIFYLAPSSIKWAARQGEKLIPHLTKSKNRFICYQNGNDKKSKYMEGPYLYPEQKAQLKKLILENRNKGVATQLSGASDTCLALCNLLTELKGESLVTRTGLLALWDLLIHGASKVTLLGMSFYHGGGHMFRVIPDDKPLDPNLNHLHQRSPHDSLVEVQFLKLLMELFPGKIVLEAPLASLFDGILGEK